MPNIFQKAGDALKHAWSIFNGRDRPLSYMDYGPVYSYRPYKQRLISFNDRTIIGAVYNRIAMDVVGVEMHHVKLDENGQYSEIIKDGLENVIGFEANIDQNRFAYGMDLILSMFTEGVVAEVIVQADFDPEKYTSGFSIEQLRTGKVLEWMPKQVRVRLYNDRTGQQEDVIVPKNRTCIHENPFYSVMNEPMGVLQRLLRKMNQLDAIDEQSSSGKLNMILQFPYLVDSDRRKASAKNRLTEIQEQLNGSKYGIAYTDGTEKIIQLNRPLENNLMAQIEYLTNMLYSQLGITSTILDGTADEKTMMNYYNRTIEPILTEIANERKRKFLSQTAREQGESIMYFRNPFKLTPAADLAEIMDKMTRNAILSSNEARGIIGYKPVDDPIANELSNKNMPQQDQPGPSADKDQNDRKTGEIPYA